MIVQHDSEILKRAIDLRKRRRCREAVELYESVAGRNPLVYGPIGLIYYKGEGDISRDIDYAIRCYQKVLDDTVTPAISRAFIAACYEKRFRGIEHCERYLEMIADSDDPVCQLASFWIFVLRFRRERSSEERRQARAYGEKAAAMGHVHALKFIGEVYLKEGKILKGMLSYVRGAAAQIFLSIFKRDDIRLKKF